MSDSVYTNTNRSPSLADGTHDTGLYDPDRHDNQIVAVYETTERAAIARDMLVKAGIPAGSIQLMDQSQMPGTTPVGDASDHGIWSAIKSLFVPDEDAYGYAEGVRRGHAVLSVDPGTDVDRHHVIEVLESTDPIDFDGRLEEWRQAGYSHPSSGAIGAAAGMTTPAPAPSTYAETATTKVAAVDMPATPAVPAAPVATASTDDAETIKVMEERLRVGKREVARGAVRVRSYLVERPVEEQVSLHDERVTLERHAVDRPASQVDADAFRDRTIEVRATGEEAVVAKEARVVEEIGIRKEATDRVETVHDTVRSTKVEVEDTTSKVVPPAPGGTADTGGKTVTATTGAESSGMNAPRK